MKATSMYICLEGLKFFARHGVAPQETVVGANFTIENAFQVIGTRM